jgi:hypothetical protein
MQIGKESRQAVPFGPFGPSTPSTANPGIGDLIRGGGGIRKVRIAIGVRGKSGGARVIYHWAVRKDTILLLYAYPKNVAADLTPRQISQLARIIKEEFGNEKRNV